MTIHERMEELASKEDVARARSRLIANSLSLLSLNFFEKFRTGRMRLSTPFCVGYVSLLAVYPRDYCELFPENLRARQGDGPVFSSS